MRPGPGGFGGQRPEVFENMTPPEGLEPGQPPQMPEGMEPGQPPQGMENMAPPGGFGGMNRPEDNTDRSQANDLFYMQDKVNFFSGVADKTK